MRTIRLAPRRGPHGEVSGLGLAVGPARQCYRPLRSQREQATSALRAPIGRSTLQASRCEPLAATRLLVGHLLCTCACGTRSAVDRSNDSCTVHGKPTFNRRQRSSASASSASAARSGRLVDRNRLRRVAMLRAKPPVLQAELADHLERLDGLRKRRSRTELLAGHQAAVPAVRGLQLDKENWAPSARRMAFRNREASLCLRKIGGNRLRGGGIVLELREGA